MSDEAKKNIEKDRAMLDKFRASAEEKLSANQMTDFQLLADAVSCIVSCGHTLDQRERQNAA